MNSGRDRADLPVTAQHKFKDLLPAESVTLNQQDLSTKIRANNSPNSSLYHFLEALEESGFVNIAKAAIYRDVFRRAIDLQNNQAVLTLLDTKPQPNELETTEALLKDLKDSGFDQEQIEELLKHYYQLPDILTGFLMATTQGIDCLLSAGHCMHISYIYQENGKVYANIMAWNLGLRQMGPDGFYEETANAIPGRLAGRLELTDKGFALTQVTTSNTLYADLITGEKISNLNTAMLEALETECAWTSKALNQLIVKLGDTHQVYTALVNLRMAIVEGDITQENQKLKNQLVISAYSIIEALSQPNNIPSQKRLLTQTRFSCTALTDESTQAEIEQLLTTILDFHFQYELGQLYEYLEIIGKSGNNLGLQNLILNEHHVKLLTEKITASDAPKDQQYLDQLLANLSPNNFDGSVNAKTKITLLKNLIQKASRLAIKNIIRGLDTYTVFNDKDGKLNQEIATCLFRAAKAHDVTESEKADNDASKRPGLITMEMGQKHPGLSEIIYRMSMEAEPDEEAEIGLNRASESSGHNHELLLNIIGNTSDQSADEIIQGISSRHTAHDISATLIHGEKSSLDNHSADDSISFRNSVRQTQELETIPSLYESNKEQLDLTAECIGEYKKTHQKQFEILGEFETELRAMTGKQVEGDDESKKEKVSKSALLQIGREAKAKHAQFIRKGFGSRGFKRNRVYKAFSELEKLEGTDRLFDMHEIRSQACAGVVGAVLELDLEPGETLNAYVEKARMIDHERSLGKSDQLNGLTKASVESAKTIIHNAKRYIATIDQSIQDVVTHRLQHLVNHKLKVTTENFNSFGKVDFTDRHKIQLTNDGDTFDHDAYIRKSVEFINRLLEKDDLLFPGNADEICKFICEYLLSLQTPGLVPEFTKTKIATAVGQALAEKIKTGFKLPENNDEIINAVISQLENSTKEKYSPKEKQNYYEASLQLLASRSSINTDASSIRTQFNEAIDYAIAHPTPNNLKLLADTLNSLIQNLKNNINIEKPRLKLLVEIITKKKTQSKPLENTLIEYFSERESRVIDAITYFHGFSEYDNIIQKIIDKHIGKINAAPVLEGAPPRPTYAEGEQKARLYIKEILKKEILNKFEEAGRDVKNARHWNNISQQELNMLSTLRILSRAQGGLSTEEVKNILGYLNSELQIQLPEGIIQFIDVDNNKTLTEKLKDSWKETQEAKILKAASDNNKSDNGLLAAAEATNQASIIDPENNPIALYASTITEKQVLEFIVEKINQVPDGTITGKSNAKKAFIKIAENTSYTYRERIRLIGIIADHKANIARSHYHLESFNRTFLARGRSEEDQQLYEDLAAFAQLNPVSSVGIGNNLNQLLTDFYNRRHQLTLPTAIRNTNHKRAKPMESLDAHLAIMKLKTDEYHRNQDLKEHTRIKTGFSDDRLTTTPISTLLNSSISQLHTQQSNKEERIEDNNGFAENIVERVRLLRKLGQGFSIEDFNSLGPLSIVPHTTRSDWDKNAISDENYCQNITQLVLSKLDIRLTERDEPKPSAEQKMAIADFIAVIFAKGIEQKNEKRRIALYKKLRGLRDFPVDLSELTHDDFNKFTEIKSDLIWEAEDKPEDKRGSLKAANIVIPLAIQKLKLVDGFENLSNKVTAKNAFNYLQVPNVDLFSIKYNFYLQRVIDFIDQYQGDSLETDLESLENVEDDKAYVEYLAQQADLTSELIIEAYESLKEAPELRNLFVTKYIETHQKDLAKLVALDKAIPKSDDSESEPNPDKTRLDSALDNNHRQSLNRLADELEKFTKRFNYVSPSSRFFSAPKPPAHMKEIIDIIRATTAQVAEANVNPGESEAKVPKHSVLEIITQINELRSKAQKTDQTWTSWVSRKQDASDAYKIIDSFMEKIDHPEHSDDIMGELNDSLNRISSPRQ